MTIRFFSMLNVAVHVLAGLVFAFLIVPIIAIIPMSFTSGSELVYPVPGWSLRWYEDFFARAEWIISIKNSIILGIGSATLATVIGTTTAIGLQKTGPRLRAGISALVLLPMVIPVVVTGVSLFFFYATLDLVGTMTGLVLSHATIALPFVFVTVRASLQGLSPQYALAAANLGASPHRVFMRTTLPLISPGIASGALFAFAVSLDDVVIAGFVGGPQQLTLPRQMFAGVRENISPTVLSAASLLILMSCVLMVVSNRLTSRSRRLQQPQVKG
jgi:putative spermidine/putrescine transport system permease protein